MMYDNKTHIPWKSQPTSSAEWYNQLPPWWHVTSFIDPITIATESSMHYRKKMFWATSYLKSWLSLVKSEWTLWDWAFCWLVRTPFLSTKRMTMKGSTFCNDEISKSIVQVSCSFLISKHIISVTLGWQVSKLFPQNLACLSLHTSANSTPSLKSRCKARGQQIQKLKYTTLCTVWPEIFEGANFRGFRGWPAIHEN